MPALTITGGSVALSFLAAQSDDGTFLIKTPVVNEEVLATEGVNGRRWRTISKQMVPVLVETLAEASTWTLAVSLAQSHRDMVGSLVALVWVAGGSTYTYKDVHISAASPRPAAGSVVGAGASSGSAYHVRTTWALEPTDFHVFAT